jgi:hypothetical protein
MLSHKSFYTIFLWIIISLQFSSCTFKEVEFKKVESFKILNTDKKDLPSAPATAYTHIGNGTNMIYVDEEHELVIVSRWTDNSQLDEVVRRFLAALKP